MKSAGTCGNNSISNNDGARLAVKQFQGRHEEARQVARPVLKVCLHSSKDQMVHSKNDNVQCEEPDKESDHAQLKTGPISSRVLVGGVNAER